MTVCVVLSTTLKHIPSPPPFEVTALRCYTMVRLGGWEVDVGGAHGLHDKRRRGGAEESRAKQETYENEKDGRSKMDATSNIFGNDVFVQTVLFSSNGPNGRAARNSR